MTVESGGVEIIKDSLASMTDARRLQAIFIAFAFGAIGVPIIADISTSGLAAGARRYASRPNSPAMGDADNDMNKNCPTSSQRSGSFRRHAHDESLTCRNGRRPPACSISFCPC
ncbi:hypothetical protein AGMMS49974_11010 [Deltaproteobacteria bacterium]|nr:hypothetical protein AGMMS49974_11010 [Deltaproteobacteria bacterium]